MANLNIPDELYAKLEQLAATENRSIDEQTARLLEKALQKTEYQTASDLSKSMAEILAESRLQESLVQEEWPNQTEILAGIRSRRRASPAELGLPDSTTLIREDRD